MRGSLLEWALHYACLGYQVLPLDPGRKKACRELIPWGFRYASSDPVHLEKWFHQRQDLNLGILPPWPVLVLDLDQKPNQQPALEKLQDLLQTYRLGTAPLVATPSGGYHLYLRTPPEYSCLPPELQVWNMTDLRGMNMGYITAPPSRVSTGDYRWKQPLVEVYQLPLCPPELLKAVGMQPWKG